MHELGITQNIIDIVSQNVQSEKVKRVTLEIGQLSAIMPDAIRFCFDVCAKNTIVEGAELEILLIPGLGVCRDCKTEVSLTEPFGICTHCHSIHLDIVRGQELKIKAIELEAELCV